MKLIVPLLTIYFSCLLFVGAMDASKGPQFIPTPPNAFALDISVGRNPSYPEDTSTNIIWRHYQCIVINRDTFSITEVRNPMTEPENPNFSWPGRVQLGSTSSNCWSIRAGGMTLVIPTYSLVEARSRLKSELIPEREALRYLEAALNLGLTGCQIGAINLDKLPITFTNEVGASVKAQIALSNKRIASCTAVYSTVEGEYVFQIDPVYYASNNKLGIPDELKRYSQRKDGRKILDIIIRINKAEEIQNLEIDRNILNPPTLSNRVAPIILTTAGIFHAGKPLVAVQPNPEQNPQNGKRFTLFSLLVAGISAASFLTWWRIEKTK